ncbi:MAG: FAD:protein FMN transferase [Burkholderiales bacterium]
MCLFSLAGAPVAYAGEPFYQSRSYVFGTLATVTVSGEAESSAREAIAAVFADFDRLHWMLHAWKPGELTTINQAIAAGKARIPVNREIAAVIRDSTLISGQSGGLFNPAIGRLVGLWGFHKDRPAGTAPDTDDIARLVNANPRMRDLRIDDGTLTSRNPAVQLDFGGYAKGYALDRAAGILRRRGVKNALINLGGNLMALGRKGSASWRVGLQNPRGPGVLATLELRDGEAIGTSGDYQRFYIVNGRRVAHIIDPRTGYPVPDVQAVTVLISGGKRAGVLSDAMSKPIFIEGVSGWRAAAARLAIGRVLLVDDRGIVHLTRAMRKRLIFPDSTLSLSIQD